MLCSVVCHHKISGAKRSGYFGRGSAANCANANTIDLHWSIIVFITLVITCLNTTYSKWLSRSYYIWLSGMPSLYFLHFRLSWNLSHWLLILTFLLFIMNWAWMKSITENIMIKITIFKTWGIKSTKIYFYSNLFTIQPWQIIIFWCPYTETNTWNKGNKNVTRVWFRYLCVLKIIELAPFRKVFK